MTTIKDIAKKANVPVSTVSYVLNRKGKPTKEKHKRILDIAKQLNYVPNQKAISLVSGRANNVGMIISRAPAATFSEPFFSEVLYNLTLRLSQDNVGLTLYTCDSADVAQLSSFVLNGNADAMIWYMGIIPEEIKLLAAQRNLPLLVLLEKDSRNDDVNVLTSDDYAAEWKVLQYLYDTNHRDLLFVSGYGDSPRIAAYTDFCEKHGLRHRILRVGSTVLDAYRSMDEFLQQGNRGFTAIAAETDVKAIGVMQALKKWQIAVPDDVSVIGYDDIPLALLCDPPLTTVQQTIGSMVDDAVRILMDKIDNGDHEPIHKLYVHDLVIRGTTALRKD